MVQGAGGEPQARAEAPDALAGASRALYMPPARSLWGFPPSNDVFFHPPNGQGHADRVFYESLLHQRPESKMAKKWCLEYGVLKWADAEALCKELGISIVRRPCALAPSFNLLVSLTILLS